MANEVTQEASTFNSALTAGDDQTAESAGNGTTLKLNQLLGIAPRFLSNGDSVGPDEFSADGKRFWGPGKLFGEIPELFSTFEEEENFQFDCRELVIKEEARYLSVGSPYAAFNGTTFVVKRLANGAIPQPIEKKWKYIGTDPECGAQIFENMEFVKAKTSPSGNVGENKTNVAK